EVAEDLPVDEEVGLDAQVVFAVGGFVDGGGAVELEEDEEIGADLDVAEVFAVGEGEGGRADAAHGEVVDRSAEGQAGVDQSEGVEGVVVGAGLVAAEGVGADESVVVAGGEEEFARGAGAAWAAEDVVELGVQGPGGDVLCGLDDGREGDVVE